jgi:hypothetical protein
MEHASDFEMAIESEATAISGMDVSVDNAQRSKRSPIPDYIGAVLFGVAAFLAAISTLCTVYSVRGEGVGYSMDGWGHQSPKPPTGLTGVAPYYGPVALAVAVLSGLVAFYLARFRLTFPSALRLAAPMLAEGTLLASTALMLLDLNSYAAVADEENYEFRIGAMIWLFVAALCAATIGVAVLIAAQVKVDSCQFGRPNSDLPADEFGDVL